MKIVKNLIVQIIHQIKSKINNSGFKNKGKCDFQDTSKYSNLVDMSSNRCYFQFQVSYLKFKNFLSHKSFFF